jgi:thymidylate synthase (FAD)
MQIDVLDKGFIRLVDKMGDDSSIVRSARVSYGNGTKTKRDDEKLIRYLINNKHESPLEMVNFQFHIKCPIFVQRQLVRHRISSMNEISARYSEMKEEFYIPKISRIKTQSKTNKQCSGEELSLELQQESINAIATISNDCYNVYKGLLERGVAREIARIVLPVNLYTEFYWQINLRSLFNFIALRNHSHAQEEIREYAIAIENIIKDYVPIALDAFKQQLNK